MAKLRNVDHFDPADQETVELVTPQHTPKEGWLEDTMADPEGVEARNAPQAIALPDYYYRKYAIDDEGKATFRPDRVTGIMKVFEAKKDTPMVFNADNDEARKKEEDYFAMQVETVELGLQPLLEVDPQSTGYNFLQLVTRTWAEFAAICYEYKEEADRANPNDELPTWLIEREEKMFGLGRKARMLSAVVANIDDKFGLKDTKLNATYVQNEVQRRQQRLAEWNYNNSVNISQKVATDLNQASTEYTKTIFNNA